MNRKQIEEKDQLLVKKFRKIVNNNEKKLDQKPVWKLYISWLLVFCTGLSVVGLIFFSAQPSLLVVDDSEPMIRNNGEIKESLVLERTAEQLAERDTKVLETAPETLQKERSDSSMETVQAEKELLSGEELNTEEFAETQAAGPSQAVEHNPQALGIRIAEIVACSSVSNRQFVSPKIIFSLKENSTPVVWMNVLSEKQPFSLAHVYYFNGLRYCEVPLKVNHPRTRTWSQVTLKNPENIGEWRVEVLAENGDKLGGIEFTVIP